MKTNNFPATRKLGCSKILLWIRFCDFRLLNFLKENDENVMDKLFVKFKSYAAGTLSLLRFEAILQSDGNSIRSILAFNFENRFNPKINLIPDWSAPMWGVKKFFSSTQTFTELTLKRKSEIS